MEKLWKAIVIIPAYNEESSLPRLLEEFHHIVINYDVVVVDDASTVKLPKWSNLMGFHY